MTELKKADIAGFIQPKHTSVFSQCPAKWVLNEKGMCSKCPFRKGAGLGSRAVSRLCGLTLQTIDHPYQVLDKDGKTRHFIAYPYHLNLEHLEEIVSYCKAHPGLELTMRWTGAHANAIRIDFYAKNTK